MSFILTFLGKGGTGRTTVAIAAAKQLASQGKRVLLTTQDPGPGLELLLGTPVGPEPQALEPNLKALQFQTAVLLEQSWDQVKQLEAEYVRTPFFKNVYGQELGVLPGLESALALNAIREYDASGDYDVIIVDGPGDQATLRMLGMPEVLSWYIRRFRQVFVDSDLGRVLSPFIQPIASAVLTVNWSGDSFAQPTEQVNHQLDEGKNAVANPKRVAAYLVTTSDEAAIATARYLWGSAQQVGLTVGGVLVNQPVLTMKTTTIDDQFAPLSVRSIPFRNGDHWQPLMAALPSFTEAEQAPQPMTIDLSQQQVKLFLPGFDKKQIKLTQYGPEVTIEAGDQRRNIFLPSELRGKPVQGAKFQGSYLIISF
jgi:anion-transporting  ArsA/GET3 family ATPase